ncbi:unnamed protein product [Owenia fusiformis]|uniref:Uncharacterized protein n=1 Tax=Owenia fusiformis TaxID=6347 RepID=A0A8S4NTT1_OWEFU|nr:unnamed protein product [Owenia fusiformis]
MYISPTKYWYCFTKMTSYTNMFMNLWKLDKTSLIEYDSFLAPFKVILSLNRLDFPLSWNHFLPLCHWLCDLPVKSTTSPYYKTCSIECKISLSKFNFGTLQHS